MLSFCRPALCLALLLSTAAGACAQSSVYDVVYRPPSVTYRVLESAHFDLIFQEGAAADARRTAAILERALPGTRRLVGLQENRRLHMPVVLNAFNDRSNGFVRALPFKQEIERTGIKGNRLGVRASSWLAAVAPHELTHAVHAEVSAAPGLGWAIRPFAPDVSRLLNFAAPPGLTEGLAVYRESRTEPSAGRLHAPLFTMQFWAAMTEDPWSLSQLMERPSYTRPFNRYYIGGAHFFDALAEGDSARFFTRAARFFNRVPLLGFGAALWVGTGEAPPRLGARLRQRWTAQAQARLEALGPLTEATALASADGLEHRRPRWLSDSTLVAYVQGYATRPGFYRLDARTGRRTPISYQAVTEDYYFSLGPDTSALHFARYVPDPLVLIQARADAFRLDTRTGRATHQTTDARLLAPVPAPGSGLWALQNDGPFNQWVHVAEDGTTQPMTDFARGRFQLLAPAPRDPTTVAVLLNVRGHQGLFRATVEDGAVTAFAPWLLFEDAAIYDASWGPAGRYLLFAADLGGVSNAYAYDTAQDRLLKLTNEPFGALEPSLSPDGATLAFVSYHHARWDLMRMPFAPETAEALPRARAAYGDTLPWRAMLSTRYDEAALAGDAEAFAAPADALPATRPYRARRHLAPRMAYPILKYDEDAPGDDLAALNLGAGVRVQGADPLQRWAYRASAFYQAERLWGEAFAQTGRYALRPSINVYDRPFWVNRRGASGAQRAGIEERGAELGLRLPVRLQSNVYQSSARFFLGSELRQTRRLGEGSAPASEFRTRLTLNPAAFFAYRLQANPRDLVPNAGVTLRTAAELDAWTGGRASRGLRTELRAYLPWLRAHNTGLSLGAGLLAQNAGVYDADRFVPRGYAGAALGAGTFARFDLEVTQPLWYVDDGLVLLPLYLKALYAYGFGQMLRPLGAAPGPVRSSVGAGLGLELRLFHHLDLALRLGAAYRLEDGAWDWTAR